MTLPFQRIGLIALPILLVAGVAWSQESETSCLACHGAGIGGAPILGDAAQWAPRIDQGIDVLKQHAIQGYTGSLGYMPPKGGRMDLSDDEIAGAVDYMVSESQ